jgi:hypothetical protein
VLHPLAIRKFFDTHRSLVYKYMTYRLRDAIGIDSEQVSVCLMGDAVSIMHRNLFESNLIEMIDFFKGNNEYPELLEQCESLLDQHKVNTIIREANIQYHKDKQNKNKK